MAKRWRVYLEEDPTKFVYSEAGKSPGLALRKLAWVPAGRSVAVELHSAHITDQGRALLCVSLVWNPLPGEVIWWSPMFVMELCEIST